MDKLKLAFKLVARAANHKREKGSVPAFLGARGLLALMYDRIVAFSENEVDQTEYLLDLAVMAIFGFSTSLPDMEIDDAELDTIEAQEIEASKEREGLDAIVEDTPDADDARWTPVPANQPLPTAPPVDHGDEEESDDA